MKTLLHKPSLTARDRRRSLLAVIAMLAALATSLALFFSLGARPAAAQDEAKDAAQGDVSDYLSDEDLQALAEAAQQQGMDIDQFDIAQALASKNPDSLNFGDVGVNQSKTQSVTVRADKKGCVDVPIFGCVGNFPVKIDSASVSGDNFTKDSDNCSGAEVGEGSTCSVGVRFQPNNLGFHSGLLRFAPGQVTLLDLKFDTPFGTINLGNVTVSTRFTDGTDVPLSGSGKDITPPEVASFSPTGSKVSPATNVTAKFSEDLLASSVNTNSFTLEKSDGSKVAATVSYDANTDTATLDPSANLNRGATYKAKLTSEIKDMAGNSLTEKEWTFKVAKKKRHH